MILGYLPQCDCLSRKARETQRSRIVQPEASPQIIVRQTPINKCRHLHINSGICGCDRSVLTSADMTSLSRTGVRTEHAVKRGHVSCWPVGVAVGVGGGSLVPRHGLDDLRLDTKCDVHGTSVGVPAHVCYSATE